MNTTRHNHGRVWPCALLLLCAQGCFAPKGETITCDNLLPAADATFSDVEALVLSRRKGCGDANCHGSKVMELGWRLDKRDVIYDAFTNHIDIMYGVVAGGTMPADGERWSEADLAVVRTWYCNGSYPE